jgi:hypothetical protein
VNQAIQDGIGQGGTADNIMPMIYRQLTGDQRGPQVVAIFEDF